MDKTRIEELVLECNVSPVDEVKMRHILTTAVREAYEEAARECAKEADYGDPDAYGAGRRYGCEACSDAIRKLGEGL